MNIFLFYNYLRFDSFRSCFLAYLLGATFCIGFATLSLMQNLSDGRRSGSPALAQWRQKDLRRTSEGSQKDLRRTSEGPWVFPRNALAIKNELVFFI